MPALAASVLLAGCAASTSDAPSLLPRPIENVSFDEPEAVPVTAAPDPALDAAIRKARQTLATTDAAFDIAATKAGNLIEAAAGAGVGSDPWLDAQVALAALDNHRATSLGTLSHLDGLAIERGATGKPPYTALDALRAEAQAQVAAESRRIAALSSRLPAG